MTDSHAHLTMDPIKSSLQVHLSEFKNNEGLHILNLSYDIQTIGEVISQSLEFENKYPNLILTAIGIHPEYITEDIKNLKNGIEILKETISQHRKRITAIGEIGMDYYHFDFASHLTKDEIDDLKDKQKVLLRTQIELALENKLPVSIHTRDNKESTQCTADCLKIVSQIGNGNLRGCFHSYTGSLDYLHDILAHGFYIGFNGIVTYPKAENVREILRNTPLDRILLETDAPLLPPQKVRNGKSGDIKYGKPVDVYEIAEKIAEVKKITVEKVIEISDQNFNNLFLTY